MSWFIPNILEAKNMTYSHRIRHDFMIISTLALWIGVFVLTAYTIEIIAKYLGEEKNVFNNIYMSIIIGEIIISKIISYVSIKKFGYDFWGKLNSKKYQKYLCDNCLKHINEDCNEDLFIKAIKCYGWKNISFDNMSYSPIQVQYLLDLLLDNTYDGKNMKSIIKEHIIPLMENHKNKKDIIDVILQHIHLSIKKADNKENIEIYLILYSVCIELKLEDSLSIIECNLYNFVNSQARREELETFLSFPQYKKHKLLLTKVDTILEINKIQEINSVATEDHPSLGDMPND